MARTSSRLLAGLVLFVAGAAGFVYGLIQYNAARQTLEGRLKGFGNSLVKLFNGTSNFFDSLTKDERTAVLIMAAAVVVAVIGLLLLVVRGRRRR